MKSFETSTTVGPQGDVRVLGTPFAPGDEVEVVVSPKRVSPVAFVEAWDRLWRNCDDRRRKSPTKKFSAKLTNIGDRDESPDRYACIAIGRIP